ncbi:MAG TPA: hypothetical protein VJ583_08520 [Nitrososphaeraceae archaeon]|nr:hypothetical protein [Nitrososphaeraceae archaeon]
MKVQYIEMKEREREIRIKSFQTQSFDSLINQINSWLRDKQEKNRNTFEFIDMKYQCEPSTISDSDLQYTAIAIYKDSLENLNKELAEQENSINIEEFIHEKKKLEYRK